ncbi:hypothetical protein ACO0QE_000944 [Hanseniaspora vineae]
MAKRKSRNGGSSRNALSQKGKKTNKKSKSNGTNKRGKSIFNFNRDGGDQLFDTRPAKVGKYGGFSNLNVGGGDLANPDFISDFYFGKNNMKKGSMKMSAYRSKPKHIGRRYGDDEDSVLDSDEEYEREKRNVPARKRPVIFVKALEIYDPSKELIEMLRAKNNVENNYMGTLDESMEVSDNDDEKDLVDTDNEKRDLMENDEAAQELAKDDGQKEDVESETIDYKDVYGNDESGSDGYETEGEDIYNYDEDVYQNQPSEENGTENALFFIDEEGADYKPEDVKVVEVESSKHAASVNTEFNPVLTIGKIQMNLENNPVTNEVHSVPIRKKVTKQTLDQEAAQGSKLSESFNDLELEDLPTVGSAATSAPKPNPLDSKHRNKEVGAEFGLLDCDYVATTSDIEVTNIRLGSNTQSYYVKCYKFFGSYDFNWCDEDFFVDVLHELGLPTERHDAYFQYVYKNLVPEEDERENSNYDNLYMTDSEISSDDEIDVNQEYGNYTLPGEESDSVEDSDSITSDQYEGLDDLISISQTHARVRNQEFETTSIRTVGKGKKKRLVLENELLDEETKSLLQEKYKVRLENKATKTKNTLEFIDEANKNSTDLLLKYPYGLHIKNIKDEYKTFLHDLSRQRLSFPPLDPHGNKTLEKMGKHFNLKISKKTSKSYKYITCEKTKRTDKKGPNYQLIDQLLKQRPVFMRIDRKLPANMAIKIKDEATGSTRSKFRVKEGEVVGGESSAIDPSNIGHQMLRKLGWSSGEGLGKQGQQGIVEPLQVLVKKSKRGVGHQQVPAN